MKITTSPKTIIPIVSLLLAFGMLAFRHDKNNVKLVHNDPDKNIAIIKSASEKLDTITNSLEN
ncbi:MAG: hypothetical protein QMB11_09415 [Nonlabens sp.]|jgi:hypothetical protein|uniref:hypothetical protein n=1 Tax=Nonlabens sp. TaxID=1888209 RepID=UPI0035A6405C